MPSRRKTYDGDIVGGSSGDPERRNTLSSKGKINKHAPSKRAGRNSFRFTLEEIQFHEDSEKDRYLITYADLITLLLGLFIILYAISNIDSEKYKNVFSAISSFLGNGEKITSTYETEDETILQLKNDLNSFIEQNGYESSLKIQEDGNTLTIHILEELLFSSGSAELNEKATSILKNLAVFFKNIPNEIKIEGHTDNVPINNREYQSNWHLSVSRALNTAYYFMNIEKLDPEKISIAGYSEYKPVALNDTPEGRAANRRVDIIIIK